MYGYERRDQGQGATYDETRSYYGADERLMVHNRQVGISIHSAPGGVYEEYRYDPLGRRVMVRSRTTSNSPCNPVSGYQCGSYLERTVWDGDQVFYEVRTRGADDTDFGYLEAEGVQGLPGEGASLGSVASIHAGGIDQPVQLIRTGAEGYGTVLVVPWANWQGDYAYGTDASGQVARPNPRSSQRWIWIREMSRTIRRQRPARLVRLSLRASPPFAASPRPPTGASSMTGLSAGPVTWITLRRGPFQYGLALNRGAAVHSVFVRLSLVVALCPVALSAAAAQAPEEVAMAETAVEERPALVPGSCRAPVYPVLLRSARIEGRVVLQYVVNTDGNVDPASVTTLQSPHRQFDEAARRALATCRYRPGRAASGPVRVMVQTPFTFALAATR